MEDMIFVNQYIPRTLDELSYEEAMEQILR